MDSLVSLFMGHVGGDGTTRGRNYMTGKRGNMQMVAMMLVDYLVSEPCCCNLLMENDGLDISFRDVPGFRRRDMCFRSSASVAQR